jgi:hypothetical protein
VGADRLPHLLGQARRHTAKPMIVTQDRSHSGLRAELMGRRWSTVPRRSRPRPPRSTRYWPAPARWPRSPAAPMTRTRSPGTALRSQTAERSRGSIASIGRRGLGLSGSGGGGDHDSFGINGLQSLRGAGVRPAPNATNCTGGSFRGRNARFVVNGRMLRSVRMRLLRDRTGKRSSPAAPLAIPVAHATHARRDGAGHGLIAAACLPRRRCGTQKRHERMKRG